MQMKYSWKRNHLQIIVGGCIILLLASLIALILRWPQGAQPRTDLNEPVQDLTQPDTSKTGISIAVETPPSPPVTPSQEPAKLRVGPRKAGSAERERPDYAPVNVSGRVDSWEDWNSSFSDSISRTYSAIFDSARLDTISGRLVFSPTGGRNDFLPVKRVFCVVDSVRPLVKYTFPGQDVDFVIGVGFAVGISFRGALDPGARTCELEMFIPEPETESDTAAEIMHNQFVVQLGSVPGYSYVIRTGMECASAEEGKRSSVYYLRPSVVEFRRMVKYGLLARDAGDTVLILTANPKAIVDLSEAVRRSVLRAILVPAQDPDEADALYGKKLPNVELRVNSPRILDQSFVVFNDSEALVEKNTPDPDFMHTVQLNLKQRQVDRIGYPRVTQLFTDKSAVLELKRLFLHLAHLPSN